jgi:hypothetical protein
MLCSANSPIPIVRSVSGQSKAVGDCRITDPTIRQIMRALQAQFIIFLSPSLFSPRLGVLLCTPG